MACTHTPINAQKKHTRTDAAVPLPSNAACQCPADQGVCQVHGKQAAGGHTGLVPALWWTGAVICERRASSHHDISVPTCCGRAQSLSTWDKAPNPPTTHHHVALLQAVERHCHLASATQEKTSSVCSVLMHGWLHLFAFHFFPKLGVCLLFYSCGWQWGMVSESICMYRDEQHVL